MKKNFYHILVLGLIKANGRWIIHSNAKSGNRYLDNKVFNPSRKVGYTI